MQINEIQQLTPDQRAELAKELGLREMVDRWHAEDVLKEATRRYESASSRLKSEQTKFAQVEAAEQERLNARLKTFRVDLDAAEVEHAQRIAELTEAETVIGKIAHCSADSAR